MKLNFKQYSTEGEPLLIMHGLFGSLGNWGWHSRELAKDFAVTGLDLRNHGGSPHSDDMDYACMADDVLEFMDDHRIKRCHLLGHSMGGKVAMQMALQAPQRVDHLIVADIAPVQYHGEHDNIFAGLLAIDLATIGSRNEADTILAKYEEDELVRQFLLTNLVKNPDGGFQWRINLPVLHASYANLRDKPTGSVFDGPVLFVKGALSNYITEKHRSEILQRFPQAKIKVIMHTGHWLHAEKPQTFYRIVHNFLNPDAVSPDSAVEEL
ncbi:MAG: alpha/beta fold hydrolase [Gammaproteobacteria bacterium]|nr:alpha/beta fold hydrolase [Gammaproteobacteria bacterium]MDP2142388.1 alpha/beta fold hydrolase [Gammaproteobacteria bacterium]MDP2348629.1 alpha/beta fold hydrolase [Gammaproteobacteria bacterium]